MTYEKFTAMILGNPHLLEQVATLVIDEVQMITDPSRGVNLEFILTLLRVRKNIGVEPQVIALSAVIGDTFGFERWMGARLLRSHHRPVPLDEGIICSNGDFRYIATNGEEKKVHGYMTPEFRKGSSQDYIIPLVRKLVAEGKQVIVFRETKGAARGCALYLATALGLPPALEAIQALPTSDLSQASDALRKTLAGGVAFHTADLDRDERLLIEQEFRKPGSRLKVISATTTLAMGINTPAEAIIIAGLEHPGPTPYSVAEYKNMVGRAGRLGFSTQGMSFLIPSSGAEEYHLWNHYVCGKPEDLHSHFLSDGTDIRSLLLRVLASIQAKKAVGMSATELIEFLHGSFGAFLQRDQNPAWQWDRAGTEHALGDLLHHGLIAQSSDGNIHLTPLGRLSGQSGIEVESITRLVDTLRNLPVDSITDPTLIAAAQLTVELDNVLFPINKKSTQKEPLHWTSELERQRVAPAVMGALHNWVKEQHQATLRAKKAAACLFWISDTPMSKIEATLTQHGGAFDGAAGPVRAVATRTGDLLETVARVAELTHEKLDLADRRARLLTRLQVGVSGKNVELAQYFGNRLARGDYRNLQKGGLGTVELIRGASDNQIQTSLGGIDSVRKVREMREALAERGSQNQAADHAFIPLPEYES